MANNNREPFFGKVAGGVPGAVNRAHTMGNSSTASYQHAGGRTIEERGRKSRRQKRRPFTVYKVAAASVMVEPGWCHWKGSWVQPTWDSGGFGTAYIVTGTSEVLKIKCDVSVDGEEIASDALNIAWDPTATYAGLPARQYDLDVDFTLETITWTETHTDAEVLIDIATVTMADGAITDIEQRLDYNPVLPWNRDIPTTIIEGTT